MAGWQGLVTVSGYKLSGNATRYGHIHENKGSQDLCQLTEYDHLNLKAHMGNSTNIIDNILPQQPSVTGKVQG
jgi:hypothetical protein